MSVLPARNITLDQPPQDRNRPTMAGRTERTRHARQDPDRKPTETTQRHQGDRIGAVVTIGDLDSCRAKGFAPTNHSTKIRLTSESDLTQRVSAWRA